MRIFFIATYVIWLSALGAAAEDVVLPHLFSVQGVASDDGLNIRAEPSGSSDILGALSYDATDVEVVVANDDNSWGLINYQDGTGWISMRFLAAQPGDDPWEFPDELVCHGTEPFWGLEFEAGATAQGVWFFDDRRSYIQTWAEIVTNRLYGPYAFDLTGLDVGATGFVSRESCNDGMSDREFGFRVDIIVSEAGERLAVSGCCTLSGF